MIEEKLTTVIRNLTLADDETCILNAHAGTDTKVGREAIHVPSDVCCPICKECAKPAILLTSIGDGRGIQAGISKFGKRKTPYYCNLCGSSFVGLSFCRVGSDREAIRRIVQSRHMFRECLTLTCLGLTTLPST